MIDLKGTIPRFLYRGDSDPNGVRKLRTNTKYQLHTNLISGGYGAEIFKRPLLELIEKHVFPGWRETHFLSFTKNLETGKRFALNCSIDQVERLFDQCDVCYDSSENWDFAMITLDTCDITWTQIDHGIYFGEYLPSLQKFLKFPGKCSVLLIDVLNLSDDNKKHIDPKVLENSERDFEWLLLPATPTILDPHDILQFSAIIDGKIFSDITFYSKLH